MEEGGLPVPGSRRGREETSTGKGERVMAYILLIIALLWICAGTSVIIYTKETRDAVASRFSLPVIRKFAVPVMALGAFLVLGALFSDRMFWWPLLLGLLALSKGLFLMKASPERTSFFIDWWCRDASEEVVRLHGLVTFFLGTALLTYIY